MFSKKKKNVNVPRSILLTSVHRSLEPQMSDQQQIRNALSQLGSIDRSIMEGHKCQTMADFNYRLSQLREAEAQKRINDERERAWDQKQERNYNFR